MRSRPVAQRGVIAAPVASSAWFSRRTGPPPPAVDARDDEEDLPAGLPEERDPLVGAEEGAEVHEEEHDVGEDADGPGPDAALHPEPGRDDADEHGDELDPVQLVGPDGDRGLDGLLEDVLRLVCELVTACGVRPWSSWCCSDELRGTSTAAAAALRVPIWMREPPQTSVCFVLPPIRTFTVGPGVPPGQPATRQAW